jgi:hypothetical protein
MLVPSAFCPSLGERFQRRHLLIAAEVMVPEKTDKTASPMLNGGMTEAGFQRAALVCGSAPSCFFKLE